MPNLVVELEVEGDVDGVEDDLLLDGLDLDVGVVEELGHLSGRGWSESSGIKWNNDIRFRSSTRRGSK